MHQSSADTAFTAEPLLLEGEYWQLAFQLTWSARDLRDLLLLRDVGDLPPLRVLRARRVTAGGEPGESTFWLLAEQALTEQQQRRCRERGVVWLDARELPVELSSYCADLPMTRLIEGRDQRSPVLGWVVALIVLAGVAMLLVAHGHREQRIAEQNQRAAALIISLHSAPAPRAPVEQLHAALVALGVPALVGDRVLVRVPEGLSASAEARLLDEALTPGLRAEITDLQALQAYLDQQARRAGQKRLIMGTEHCDHAGERVIPMPGHRAFVLRLQQVSAWDTRLRWAGVERVEPQQLRGCLALPADG